MLNESSFNMNCIKCSQLCSNKEYLTCTECEKQIHYFCSDLPVYYIIVFEDIESNYYCYKCIKELSKEKDYAKRYKALKKDFDRKRQLKELDNMDKYIEKLEILDETPAKEENEADSDFKVAKEKSTKGKKSKKTKLKTSTEKPENEDLNGVETGPGLNLENAYDAEFVEMVDLQETKKSKICVSHLAMTVSEDETNQNAQGENIKKENETDPKSDDDTPPKRVKRYRKAKDKPRIKPCNEFECLECEYSTKSRSLFLRHKKDAHKKKTLWKCKLCNHISKRYSYIRRHMGTHSKYKPHKCEICNFSAVKEVYLKRHMKLHQEKPFACTKCRYRTSENSLLLKHAKRCEGKDFYYCDKCEYKAKNKRRLAVHNLTHTGERPYQCALCPYGAKEKTHYNKHMRTHLKIEDRPHKCTYCTYAATEKGALTLHIRTHTKEKPFKCRFCEHRTSNKRLLKHHECAHTGLNLFHCSYCTYSCKYRGDLNVHERKHTGEKPYKCTICDFAAASKTNLNKHMNSHHGVERPYKYNYTSGNKTFISHGRSHNQIITTTAIPTVTPTITPTAASTTTTNFNEHFGITEPLKKKKSYKIATATKSHFDSNIVNNQININRAHHASNVQLTASNIPTFVNPTIDPTQINTQINAYNLSKDMSNIPPYSLILNQAVLRSNLDAQNSAYNIPAESTFNFSAPISQANIVGQNKHTYPVSSEAVAQYHAAESYYTI